MTFRQYALVTGLYALSVWAAVFAGVAYFAHTSVVGAVIAANLAVVGASVPLIIRNLTR